MFPKLLRPFDYLRIKHEIKDRYDFLFPFIMSGAATTIFFVLPVAPQVFGQDGLVSNILSTIQILTGFYIASLAAIATFNKRGLDNLIEGKPATLKSNIKGKILKESLTRRKFLCLLFGYLALLSIVVNLISVFAKLCYPSLVSFNIDQHYYFLIKFISLFIYFFIISNLFTTTLLGLYYMSDRIHRYKPELKKRDPKPSAKFTDKNI